MQRDLTKRFEGGLAFDARFRDNPRVYGQVLGVLFAKGLITMGTTGARVAPSSRAKKKRRSPASDREANHHVAPPPSHTTCMQSEFVVTSAATGNDTHLKAHGDIECCFYSLRLPQWLGHFLAHHRF